jgi:hypothetical protein
MGDTTVMAIALVPRAALAAWQRKELSTPPEKATATAPFSAIMAKRAWYFSSKVFSDAGMKILLYL